MSPRIWIGVTLLLVQAAVANGQPKNLEALYRAGVEALQRDLPFEALELLNSVAAMNPGFRDVQFLLGQSCFLAGLMQPAKVHFEKALEANPQNGPAAFFLGMVLYQETRYFEAVEAFRRAHDLVPQNPYSLIYRGRALLKLGRADEARADIASGLALSPGDPEARCALAELELAEAHFQKAEDLLRAVLVDQPGTFEARILLGRTLFQSGRPAEAVPVFREVLKAAPVRNDVLYLLAQALLRSGDTQAGRAALARFKEHNAREEQIRGLEAAVSIEKYDTESRIHLVRLLLDQGQTNNALPHLAVLGELVPTDPRVRALADELERQRGAKAR